MTFHVLVALFVAKIFDFEKKMQNSPLYVVPHFIDIQGKEPIRQAPRKYTPKMQQTAWAEVDRMLGEGIVEPSPDEAWR